MNLLECWSGPIPACPESGGLATHCRFGARSGASIIFLGTVKLLLEAYLVGLLRRYALALFIVMILLIVMVGAAELELPGVWRNSKQNRSSKQIRSSGPETKSLGRRKDRGNV